MNFALLQPQLELVATKLKQRLIKMHERVRQLFSLEVGFGLITTSRSDSKVKIGLIGREDTVGANPMPLGSDRRPYHLFLQGAGEMLRIETPALCAVIDQSASLNKVLLRNIQVQFVRKAQTAFANASVTVINDVDGHRELKAMTCRVFCRIRKRSLRIRNRTDHNDPSQEQDERRAAFIVGFPVKMEPRG